MTTPTPPAPDALPLDELSIVPDWLKATPKSFENHPGDRGDRGPRRDGGGRPPGNRDRRPDRPREDRPRRPAGAPAGKGPRPERRDGPRPPRGPIPDRRPAPAPVTPAAVEIAFVPEEQGFAAMVETMKHSHRAYALFDVAKLVLNKPERHVVQIARKPGADGARAPLFKAVADETVFLSEDEAVRHAVRSQFDTLCRQEKKSAEPPKGNFTSVSRCGITGEVFGPSNYHEYQTLLVRHHQRRLRQMPFDEFKSRIQTVTDPEAVKRWLESKSTVTEFHCARCTDGKPFGSHNELEQHLTTAHRADLVASAGELAIAGTASRQQASAGIAEAIRLAWLGERRFPLKTAQTISDRLRKENFHFFKHGKTVVYVSFIRLQRFETLDGLKEQVQKIITFLRAHPDSTRRQLFENLLPGAATSSPEEASLLADLHWLIQDGYVVEFADGKLWTLENRAPKPAAVEKPEVSSQKSEDGAPKTETVPASPAPAPEPGTENREPGTEALPAA